MFLAINEIKASKLRYFLVIGVVFLIAYLVFFLTGLSYGLAQDNRTAIDKWQAEDIIVASESNNNLAMSQLTKQAADAVTATEKAYLTQLPSVLKVGGEDETTNVSFLGIDRTQFLKPAITSGRMFQADNEAVIDDSLQELYGIKLGETLALTKSTVAIKVVGIMHQAKYNVAPVIYVSQSTIDHLKGMETSTASTRPINAIVTRGSVSGLTNDMKQLTIQAFINKLPGYNAQVLTFAFMIGFLIVIAAIVISIFIYVLTMQKVAIFGVMKAQGISSGYIAKSVVMQTFLLATAGVLAGVLCTIGSAYVLPEKVPFQLDTVFFVGIGCLMVLFAVLGAFFSVRAIVKIDPLKAIG